MRRRRKSRKGLGWKGKGKDDEAKECYESLRELGEKSTADQYLKKLHDIKEKDIRCFGRFSGLRKFGR